MLPNCCMYDPTVEQYLGCVCDGIENGQGFLEFLIVIVTEGLDPSLYFLFERHGAAPKAVEDEILSLVGARSLCRLEKGQDGRAWDVLRIGY